LHVSRRPSPLDVLTYEALRAACASIWSGAVVAGIRQVTGARAITLGKPSPVALRDLEHEFLE
jgi:ribonucleotide monophosphatase NagD (HAD superfamily)